MKAGKILLSFAHVGKKLREVPRVGFWSVCASWNFSFIRQEAVTLRL